ncbi:MAG: hypothetical protein QXU54_00255 [Candidatus Micrarchaeia archaeon]
MELQKKAIVSGSQNNAFKCIGLLEDITIAKHSQGIIGVRLWGNAPRIFDEIVQRAKLFNANAHKTLLQELQLALSLDEKNTFKFQQHAPNGYSETETFEISYGHANLYYATLLEKARPPLEKMLACWRTSPLLGKDEILMEVVYSSQFNNVVSANLLNQGFIGKFIDIISISEEVRATIYNSI